MVAERGSIWNFQSWRPQRTSGHSLLLRILLHTEPGTWTKGGSMSVDGNEKEWKEFALKFRGTVKEINPKLHLLIQWAEMEPDEITGDRIGELH